MGFNLSHPKHPDRTVLLAWSEGELPWWKSVMVRRHVRGCWQCKGQVSELESIVCAVSVSLEQMPEPGRVDVAKAYWRFREAVREREKHTPATHVPALRLMRSWRVAAVAVLATAALAYVANWPRFAETDRKPAPAIRHEVRRQAASIVEETPATPARKAVDPPVPLLLPPSEDLPAMPSIAAEDEIIAAEINAMAALHRSRFCLTSGIKVQRDGPVVTVSGTTQSRDQRNRIAGILAGISSPQILKLQLTDPDDLLAGTTGASTTAVNREIRRVPPPILEVLRESLSGGRGFTDRDVFNLMNSIAVESERVSSDAWALRHLAEQFPQSRTRRLRPELAVQLLQMVDDHAISLVNELQSLQSHMDLASGSKPAEGIGAAPRDAETWQASVLNLQKKAEEVVRQLLASFSTDADSRPPSGIDYAALLRSLHQETRKCFSLAEELRSDLQTLSANAAR